MAAIHEPLESVPPNSEARLDAPPAPSHRRKFVLCFDGTGNKFSGTESDSNILKIFRMLDRTDHTQYHYYQPGIGTYVAGHTLSHTSSFARFKSWYMKAKDSAIGTSFDQHVIGGYKFLMRYYRPNDEIYFFGFSRGAYTARFLAEMIDHVGLLSQGNEELIRFAWKTFEKWQSRTERNAKEEEEKEYLLNYMCAFRETFSRPVRPIQFLGLFDTVNSVPRFENALMSRSKFPYTARSSAKVIRHAVAINERRAKFRQDLISESKGKKVAYRAGQKQPLPQKPHGQGATEGTSILNGSKATDKAHSAHARPELVPEFAAKDELGRGRQMTLDIPSRNTRFRDHSEVSGIRSLSKNSRHSDVSSDVISHEAPPQGHEFDDEPQDIKEVWFAGCHADIGGGWPMGDDEEVPLSHIPLVWMVREAQRAGLHFDTAKVRALHCTPEEHEKYLQPKCNPLSHIPKIVTTSPSRANSEGKFEPQDAEKAKVMNGNPPTPVTNGVSAHKADLKEEKMEGIARDDLPEFHQKLCSAATAGMIHDVLQFNNGAGKFSVMAWNFMEYLPFRRMDLQEDGSWKSITWPLPKGEVRDIPDNVVVHNSVLRRMHVHEDFRPGNLICGGGGRGVRNAPPELKMGEWKVLREEGDWVGEVYVRDGKPVGTKQESTSIFKKLLGKIGRNKSETNGVTKSETNGNMKSEMNGNMKMETNGYTKSETNGYTKSETNGATQSMTNGV